MKKVYIWLGPAVVCLQIYCWSPAIYVPNGRQNYRNSSQASHAQNWPGRIRQTNGKFLEGEKAWELILSFCLLPSIWKYLDDDEELQIGQPAAVVASFLNSSAHQTNSRSRHEYALRQGKLMETNVTVKLCKLLTLRLPSGL